MPGIEGLGHVGIHTEDLMKMRDFYTRVMGLQIADENLDRGIVFLSANPDYEHHEFVLTRGRDVPQGAKVVQQISFKVTSPDDLKDYHRRLRAEQISIERSFDLGLVSRRFTANNTLLAVIELLCLPWQGHSQES